MTRLIKDDDSGTSKRQSTCHLPIAIRLPPFSNSSLERESSCDGSCRDVERGCFPGWANFLITEHVEWTIDTSARRHSQIFCTFVRRIGA